MQVIEVDYVVLDKLGTLQQIPQKPRVVGNGDAQGVFDCSHGADGVNRRSDTADALGEHPGIPGIPAGQQQLDAAKHHPCTPGIRDPAVLNLHLETEVPFDARYRINGHLL
jgi:hypothetical protein